MGKRLGKYDIGDEIGRGGMGAVYVGYDSDLGRRVAVKVLAPHLAWQQDSVRRFLREARAVARLRHPNIVTIYDVGQQGEEYYYVMEFLEGESLAQLLRRRGPLPVDEALSILRPLADALDHAHSAGLVHRDIKPANVIVEESGQVTLTDFGIALVGEETRLTQTGVVVGTAEYMSPEQARGGDPDPRTDGYAMGVMAYQMLSGQVPYSGSTPHAILHKVIYDPPPSIRQIRPELPESLDSVLQRELRKAPEERYATVHGFVDALGQALVTNRPESAMERRSPAGRPPARRLLKPRVLAATAGIVVLLLAILGFIAAREPPSATGGNVLTSERTGTTAEPTSTPRNVATPAPSKEAVGAQPSPGATVPVDSTDAQPEDIRPELILFNVDEEGGQSLYASDLEGDGPHLLASGADRVSGSPSADGERVIVQYRLGGSTSLYLMKPDGSDRQVILGDAYAAWAYYVKGSERIRVWWVERLSEGDAYSYAYSLSITDANGSNPVLLADRSQGVAASWAEDGDVVALSVKRGDTYSLTLNDYKGNELRTIEIGASGSYNPDLSPDGSLLAYKKPESTGQALYLLELDGGEPQRILSGDTVAPLFYSPSGEWLLVMEFVASGDEQVLYSVDTRTGQVLRLMSAQDFEATTFSPDDRWLLTMAELEGLAHLYLLSPDGAERSRLVGPDDDPAWHADGYFSPDGSTILARKGYAETGEVVMYLMSTEGVLQKVLVPGAEWPASGSFSASGAQIVFDSEMDGKRVIQVADGEGGDPATLLDGYAPILLGGRPGRMAPFPGRPTPTPTVSGG